MGQNGKKVIGKIEYYSACGSSSYVSYFYDEEKYLKAIQEESYYNIQGFRYTTLSDDKELAMKADLMYKKGL